MSMNLMSGSTEIPVRVADIVQVSERVKRFRFEPVTGGSMPVFSAGAHVVVSMNIGSRRARNPYSLMGSLTDLSAYEISVLKTVDSRGGSVFLHDWVKIGDRLTVSTPVNLFPVAQRGRKFILIAGGIGITPMIAMAEQLTAQKLPFELHYAYRNDEAGAYADTLKARYGNLVHLYVDSREERIPLDALLRNQPLGTHLYVCGPGGMINWVLETGRKAGWPEENLHSERFLAPPSGKPFSVVLERSKKTVTIGEHESILEAIEASGVEPPYLCRGGACGQCLTGVVSCDGTLEHHDHYLSPEERDGNQKIMICVSRIKGGNLVLDL